jgi:hypothetical protein
MGGDACCVVVRLLACSHSRSAVRYNLHSGVLCECCMVYGRRAASVGADGSVHVTTCHMCLSGRCARRVSSPAFPPLRGSYGFQSSVMTCGVRVVCDLCVPAVSPHTVQLYIYWIRY